jgi:hypothetical protein
VRNAEYGHPKTSRYEEFRSVVGIEPGESQCRLLSTQWMRCRRYRGYLRWASARPCHVCRRHRGALSWAEPSLDPQQVAFLISADLFVCGIVTIIQSLGATQWFGIKMPVMMGVTFAAVGPMVAIANNHAGPEAAQVLFGSIIGVPALSASCLRRWPGACCGSSRPW